MRSNLSLLFAGVAAIISPASAYAGQTAVQRFHGDHVLGTSLDITVVADTPAAGALAFMAAKSEIARLDKILSTWRDDSEISALNASKGAATPSPDLLAVLRAAEDWRLNSEGAFSARMGLVESAWREGELSGVRPSPASLQSLASSAAEAKLDLDGAGGIVRPSELTFAVDGLAKGYIIDAALRAGQAAAPGVRGMMLDIGGDMRCAGASPSGAGWVVGVVDPGAADNALPVQLLRLQDQAVATSGLGKRDRVIDGCAYAHTLSPFTGQAVDTPSVTVVANRAADADALASALLVLPVSAGLSLIERTNGAEARIVSAGGAVSTSSGWTSLVTPISTYSPQSCAPAAATKAWPSGFTVQIDYTIPQINQSRVKAPYVVIWVTDDDGKIVRTLFHLGDRPARFLDSNYIWYRAFTAQTPNLWGSVTRPSRGPGKYDVEWDGKDDAGKLVGQGQYTINVEASREHGGHSLQQIKLTLGDTPQSGAGAAGGELGATAVRYGKAP